MYTTAVMYKLGREKMKTLERWQKYRIKLDFYTSRTFVFF